MKVSKAVLAAVVVLGCVAAVLLFKGLSRAVPPVVASDAWHRVKGSRSAGVKIIEYSDYQCPACATASKMIDEAIKEHPDEVSLEHRHFPLPMHPNAFRAAVFAECAGVQDKFWAFHDTLFRTQASWVKMANVDLYFKDLAMGLGVDGVMLQACVGSDAIKNKIQADVAVGKTKGIESTPTFFIGDKRVVGSTNLARELKELLK
jgi:protein-disulfide isomerase